MQIPDEHAHTWYFEVSYSDKEEFYSKITFTFKERKSEDELREMAEKARLFLAEQLEIPVDCIREIPEKEYQANALEDDEDDCS